MKTTLRAATVSAAMTLALLAPAATASAWAPADDATVRPGVQTITGGTNQCTANFVFSDGTTTYIGQAAHCSGTGAANETDGCLAGSMPLGTQVEIEDHRNPGEFPVRGTMVYNSWLQMQADGERDRNACLNNDFALIRLDNVGADAVNPTIPFWGGPTGVADTVATLDDVFSYGNSSLRFGIEQLKPKRGTNVQQGFGGWKFDVYTVTPGIPGDSGSAFVDAQGRAIGVLSTLAAAPLPASNGVSSVSRAIAYMKAHTDGFDGVSLQNGTEPFDSSRLL
ncbi:MAG: serine protease [Actinomycetota bacterium]|nr:serine protease [Actinomycetota bacterium]